MNTFERYTPMEINSKDGTINVLSVNSFTGLNSKFEEVYKCTLYGRGVTFEGEVADSTGALRQNYYFYA